MPTSIASTSLTERTTSRRQRLETFLKAYWLRPENAFWMTIRSEMLARVPHANPSLDLCCGDGIFTFLHQGGRLAPEFDVFTATDPVARQRDARADMFDHLNEQYHPRIIEPAAETVDVGLDHKSALLEKARALDFYSQLIQHDANQALPFADAGFNLVYCNSAYWIDNIDGLLAELARITSPDGRIVLHVKLDSFTRYSLNNHRHALGENFLRVINAGRLDNWPTLASDKTWRARFARAGLHVTSSTPFITGTHVRIWEVGLRPIAPLLIRMANDLTPETRASIKADWCDLLIDVLEPLCNPELDLFAGDDEPGEIQYVLSTKRS